LRYKVATLAIAVVLPLLATERAEGTEKFEPTVLDDLHQKIEVLVCTDTVFLTQMNTTFEECRSAAERKKSPCLSLMSPFIPPMPETKDGEADAKYVALFQKIGLLYSMCLRSEAIREFAYRSEDRLQGECG